MTSRNRPGTRFVLTGMLAAIAAVGAQAQSPGAASAKAAHDTGRELFGVHCARCHGDDAKGRGDAPDLLRRVQGMSEERFAAAVLKRYRWTLPAVEAASESAAREALVRGVLSPQSPGGMPAQESQPAVATGVKTLYEYLSARGR